MKSNYFIVVASVFVVAALILGIYLRFFSPQQALQYQKDTDTTSSISQDLQTLPADSSVEGQLDVLDADLKNF